jgi:hypothetical protein
MTTRNGLPEGRAPEALRRRLGGHNQNEVPERRAPEALRRRLGGHDQNEVPERRAPEALRRRLGGYIRMIRATAGRRRPGSGASAEISA